MREVYPYKSGVYVILNTVSGRRYFGSAVCLTSRRSQHFRKLKLGRHKNIHLQRAWNKYGEAAFLFHVLLYCDRGDTLFFEQRAIDIWSTNESRDRLYNINPSATSRLGAKMSDEGKLQLAERMKGNSYTLGRKISDEHRAKISASLIGNTHTLGKKFPPESAWKRLEKMKNYRPSEETKAKISAAAKGRTHSPETRARLSQINTGKTHALAHCAKISAGGKRAWDSSDPQRREAQSARARKQKLSPEHKAALLRGRWPNAK